MVCYLFYISTSIAHIFLRTLEYVLTEDISPLQGLVWFCFPVISLCDFSVRKTLGLKIELQSVPLTILQSLWRIGFVLIFDRNHQWRHMSLSFLYGNIKIYNFLKTFNFFTWFRTIHISISFQVTLVIYKFLKNLSILSKFPNFIGINFFILFLYNSFNFNRVGSDVSLSSLISMCLLFSLVSLAKACQFC